MNKPSLPPDDLPSAQMTQMDSLLRQKLEESTGKRFYEACDRITQALLSNCEWYVTTNANGLTLVVVCPTIETYWHIVSNIKQLGNRLERFASIAKVRICPPVDKGKPFEIGVDEISDYLDSL